MTRKKKKIEKIAVSYSLEIKMDKKLKFKIKAILSLTYKHTHTHMLKHILTRVKTFKALLILRNEFFFYGLSDSHLVGRIIEIPKLKRYIQVRHLLLLNSISPQSTPEAPRF